MLSFRLVAINGQAPAEPISAEFDETGGTIGRAETNQLVLPDPKRHISRVHARIVFRDGGYAIIDQGANPTHFNGQPIAAGTAQRLTTGDEITIGSYTLQVSIGAQSVGVDPSVHRAAASGPAPTPVRPSKPTDDPLGLFSNAAPGVSHSPLGDLIGQQPAPHVASNRPFPESGTAPRVATANSAAKGAARLSASQSQPAVLANKSDATHPPTKPVASSAPPPGEKKLIPEDFDPFADPFAERPPSQLSQASLPDDLDLGIPSLEASGNRGIDPLFGIKSSDGGDPFVGTPLGEPIAQPDAPLPADPFLTLEGRGLSASASDHVPELRSAFAPPAAKPDPALAPQLPPTDQNRVTEKEIFLSWESDDARRERELLGPESKGVTKVPKDDPLALFGADRVSTASSRDVPAVTFPSSEGRISGVNAQASPTHAADASPRDYRVPLSAMKLETPLTERERQLLQALILGLGMPELPLTGGLTPEVMQSLGRILREAIQGTLDLLLARAMIKHEIHADVTMIVSTRNNPLKFSPNVEAALMHLIAPRDVGFLPPIEAVRDAYDDLRSHQFGFMAGMRAALAGVLTRFRPEQLERRLAQKSMLDSLMPMNRKAKLWDLFHELYQEISQEAEADFHTLFGKEFLRAYEEQVGKLQDQHQRKD